MEALATINARIQKGLKQGGGEVLERNGVSPTELIRSVYRYMERNQALPECLDVAPDSKLNVYHQRRALLRRFDGVRVESYDPDCKYDQISRIEDKYGDLI